MTRLQRTLMAKTGAIGIVLTLLVFLTDYLGWLQPIEWWAYDQRAKDCQFFTPKPTDKLVQIDIDDRSLQSIGRRPWRRSEVAELVSEINRAGTKAVALDIIFPEPQNPEILFEGVLSFLSTPNVYAEFAMLGMSKSFLVVSERCSTAR